MTAVATEPVTPTGVRIPPLTPGSPEWLRVMSASKVAAVLGLSSYDSPFSLYHRMRGEIEPEPEKDIMRRGHYLEPAILAWLRDQHPNWTITAGGCWSHRAHDWYTASPDALAVTDSGDTEVVEVKTAANSDEWLAVDSSDIPPGYRAQVVSELDVVGVKRARVAVLLPYLELREYVIDYDEEEATFVRDRAAEFMACVHAGDRPDVDDHAATYTALRRLHGDVDDETVEVDPMLAQEFIQACLDVKAADRAKTLACSRMAEAMGRARKATCLGQQVAIRTSKSGGTPYVQIARGALR